MHSSHKPRPTRTQPRIHLEALESRWLMAHIIQTPPTAVVSIQNNGSTVSQLSDSADVTLKRSSNLKAEVQVVVSTEPPPEAAQPVPAPSLVASKTYLPGLPGLTPVGTTVPTPSPAKITPQSTRWSRLPQGRTPRRSLSR